MPACCRSRFELSTCAQGRPWQVDVHQRSQVKPVIQCTAWHRLRTHSFRLAIGVPPVKKRGQQVSLLIGTHLYTSQLRQLKGLAGPAASRASGPFALHLCCSPCPPGLLAGDHHLGKPGIPSHNGSLEDCFKSTCSIELAKEGRGKLRHRIQVGVQDAHFGDKER